MEIAQILTGPSYKEVLPDAAWFVIAMILTSGILWIVGWTINFVAKRSNVILNSIIEVLKRLEISVELLKSSNENQQKLNQKFEDKFEKQDARMDAIYNSILKSTKR